MAGNVHFIHEQGVGCRVELEDHFALDAEDSVWVSYGAESDLSVALEVYSPLGNLAVNRRGEAFELNWYDADDVETMVDSTTYQPGWVLWRVTG